MFIKYLSESMNAGQRYREVANRMHWLMTVAMTLTLLTGGGCSPTPDNLEVSGSLPSAKEQQQKDLKQTGADWVLTGGKIYTVDNQRPWAEAVAIMDGKFVYVGDEAGVAEFISDRTRISDLAGRFVMPGMVDGHTHPGYIEIEQFGATLPETSHEDLLSAVKEYADSHPEAEWIRLCCWPHGFYGNGRVGPNKQDLDAIVPDRPVWITSTVWHSYWLNSKALEVLGVDRNTPDPLPGVAYYVRDENGEPNGWVKEGAGWQHLTDQFDVDTQIHEKGMTAFLNTLSEHGVTSVYDGGNFGYEDRVYGFLSKLDRSGMLPVRYEGTYQIFVPEMKNSAIAELKRLRRTYGGNRLRFNTIKLFMDGVFANRTAAVLEPYEDVPGNLGSTMMSTDELRDFLLELNEEKIDLHVHVVGDRSLQTVLDAVEAAKGVVEGDLYSRVTLAHMILIDPEDFSRIKELGVIANFTPWWRGAETNPPRLQALGEERFARIETAKPLFDLDAFVTFSSDEWILDVLSPFLGMQVAHNRQSPNEWSSEELLEQGAIELPESERLDLESMVRGYTINGAYQLRMEDQIGSIQAGKLADLVVLDETLFEMDRYEIYKIKPSVVIMEGELIHGTLPWKFFAQTTSRPVASKGV